MVLIDNLLTTAGLNQKALAAVALSKGPGSYTGLRIGASVAKGLCYGLGIPLIGIPTLAAMVEGMRVMVDAATLLCPTIDARRNAVYTLVAHATGQIERATHVALLDQETYLQSMPNQPMLFFGDGALKCKHWIGARDQIRFVAAGLPSALHIGDLAFPMFQQAAWEKIEHYEPYYLSQFTSIEAKKQDHT
jgi:tRNA threonylcarbamoyladenosine biosynthesis protein TsaB